MKEMSVTDGAIFERASNLQKNTFQMGVLFEGLSVSVSQGYVVACSTTSYVSSLNLT